MEECSTNPLLAFRLSVLSTAAPLTDRRALWRTHICRSQGRRPIRESRSGASVAIRNGSQRSQNEVIRWFGLALAKQSSLVLSSFWSGSSRSGNGRAPKASTSGERPGVDLHTRCQSGNQRSTRVPRMFLERPSTGVVIAHSSARIREPESALHNLTPEARQEQSVIPLSHSSVFDFDTSQHVFMDRFLGEPCSASAMPVWKPSL
jgi:hypothetical protein